MTGARDLFSSEKGLFALVLVIAATVLAALNKLPISDWKTFAEVVFATYVGGKTVTTVGTAVAMRGQPPTVPDAGARGRGPEDGSGTVAPLAPAGDPT